MQAMLEALNDPPVYRLMRWAQVLHCINQWSQTFRSTRTATSNGVVGAESSEAEVAAAADAALARWEWRALSPAIGSAAPDRSCEQSCCCDICEYN